MAAEFRRGQVVLGFRHCPGTPWYCIVWVDFYRFNWGRLVMATQAFTLPCFFFSIVILKKLGSTCKKGGHVADERMYLLAKKSVFLIYPPLCTDAVGIVRGYL